MSPGVVQCVPDSPRGAWNLWRTRTCRETEGRTGLTALAVSCGAAPMAPRYVTTVNRITAELEKGDPFWGLKPLVLIWPNHGGSEAISWWFGTESWYFQIMVLSRFEGPETASDNGQAHPHSQPQDSENPKD